MCDSATSGIFARDRGHDFAPQDRGVEHVRLVDRAELAAALARGLEADARDARDLAFAVAHRVEAFVARPRALRAAAARLAEIDVAGQLADDHEVEPGDDFGLQRRRRGELRIQQRGAQVREQPERLADAEDALLGPQRARQRVVLRAADGAQQHRVGRLRERERGVGGSGCPPRRSRRRRSAPRSVSIGRPSRAQRVEHARASRDDLRARCRRPAESRSSSLTSARASPRSHARPRGRRFTATAARQCFASNARISSACCSVRPMSSRPFSRQCLRNGSTSNANDSAPSGVRDASAARGRSSA